MPFRFIPRIVFVCLAVVLVMLGATLIRPSAAPDSTGRTLALEAPRFLAIANAEEESPTAFPVDEAGIAAYFNANQPITLANVRDVFRTIEVETQDYIIGSVAVPDYPESEDVHVYVHRTGWLMAYYLAADPVAKIFDWRAYNGSAIGTKIEKVLTIVASDAGIPFPGVTFYDFRYPNGNRLMLIGETYENGNDFTVRLPGTFGFYERSCGLYKIGGGDGFWKLDGTTMGTACGDCSSQGLLTAAQLLPDTTYTVSIVPTWSGTARGGLALVYRVP
jgi:hypothetical protein